MQTRAGGFMLLEVVIAMFVLAIGILGAGALQTMSMQTTQGAYYRSQAMLIAADIVDRMRANRAALANYNNVDTDSVAKSEVDCQTVTTGCSAAELASYDIWQWTKQIKGDEGDDSKGRVLSIPNGRGVITQSEGTNHFLISITWSENEWQDGKRSGSGANSKKTYELNVALDDH